MIKIREKRSIWLRTLVAKNKNVDFTGFSIKNISVKTLPQWLRRQKYIQDLAKRCGSITKIISEKASFRNRASKRPADEKWLSDYPIYKNRRAPG